MVFHHAAIDEWSLELLTDELDQLLSGSMLPEAPQYREFVDAEHAGRNEELARELADRIATGDPPTLEMPPAGPQTGVRVAIDSVEFTSVELDARAREFGVGPAALALAALGMVLVDRYGPPARWIMTPFAKRGSETLQQVVGCCLDMRPIEVLGDDLRSAAQAVQQQMLEAQGNATLPLEALIERVRGVDPRRAEDATRFGLTYRIIDDGPTSLGQSTATPIDVDVPAARFGLCLHVERRTTGLRVWIESSRSHGSIETSRAIGRRFIDVVLGRSSGVEADPHVETTRNEPIAAPRISENERSELANAWHALLGSPPEPESDFFMQGGTSLVAMRLAAAVHKQTGRRLMLNQFLRRPTFMGLIESIRDDVEHPYAEYTSPDFDRDAPWCVAVPGSAGRAIDYHRFWLELSNPQRRAMDMLAFDLATIATNEEQRFVPGRFFARFTALTHAHAMSRDLHGPVTLVGYSLGGLVAMDMAAKLRDLGHAIDRVVLLDAYAPAYLSRTPAWYLGKLHARLRRLGSASAETRTRPTTHESGDAHAAEARRQAWVDIHRTLARWSPPTLDVPVTLVRSAPAWKHVRPVWHAATNGLGRTLGKHLEVRVLDVEHLAMLTTGADAVAEAIGDLLTIPTGEATRPSRESRRSPISSHSDRP